MYSPSISNLILSGAPSFSLIVIIEWEACRYAKTNISHREFYALNCFILNENLPSHWTDIGLWEYDAILTSPAIFAQIFRNTIQQPSSNELPKTLYSLATSHSNHIYCRVYIILCSIVMYNQTKETNHIQYSWSNKISCLTKTIDI